MSDSTVLLVPSNLDMSRFGVDADRIAFILDRVYQGIMQGNYDGEDDEYDLDAPVTINTDFLKTVLKEPSPQRLMDQIARPVAAGSRPVEHRVSRLVEEVIETDGKYLAGDRSRSYSLMEKFQVPPKEHWTSSNFVRGFYDAEKKRMDRILKGHHPSYRTACEHLKLLTLDISKEQLDVLIGGNAKQISSGFQR